MSSMSSQRRKLSDYSFYKTQKETEKRLQREAACEKKNGKHDISVITKRCKNCNKLDDTF